jgi:hypothetical protein
MSWIRRRWLPLTVLVAATSALVASIVWAPNTVWTAGSVPGQPVGPMGPMMAPAVRGDGPVRDLTGATRAAGRFADRWGLDVAEVMEFDNGVYAELADPDGKGATEVLVDPRSGVVQVEWGPAMMWNTRYGRLGAARVPDDTAAVGPEQARRIADAWLRDNRSGERADQPEAFPGYYTVHTARGDQTVSMLSVNATTGAVWYHDWHGRFIRMQERPTAR